MPFSCSRIPPTATTIWASRWPRRGKIDDAVARYRRALSLKPDNAAAHGNLGVALAAQGRIADAITHYARALVLDPGNAGIHYNLGIALAAQGRIDEAVAHYQRALALKPDNADAHNNLGNLLESMTHYKRAITINPNHAEAHNNLGNMLREQGQFDDAWRTTGGRSRLRPPMRRHTSIARKSRHSIVTMPIWRRWKHWREGTICPQTRRRLYISRWVKPGKTVEITDVPLNICARAIR